MPKKIIYCWSCGEPIYHRQVAYEGNVYCSNECLDDELDEAPGIYEPDEDEYRFPED